MLRSLTMYLECSTEISSMESSISHIANTYVSFNDFRYRYNISKISQCLTRSFNIHLLFVFVTKLCNNKF